MKFEWETISKCTYTQRAKVFGGWIVHCYSAYNGSTGASMAFIPDPEHKWESWQANENKKNEIAKLKAMLHHVILKIKLHNVEDLLELNEDIPEWWQQNK